MTRRCVTDEQYGKLWRRVTELVRRVDEGTASYKSAMDGLQDLIEKTTKFVYDIVVDYNRSLDDMIKASKYDLLSGYINAERFPLKGKGKHELNATLFHFNRYIKSDDAIAEMNRQGCRPGRIEELLALGEKYPDPLKGFSIVALGSVWRLRPNDHIVPSLLWNDSEHNLDIVSSDDGWRAYWRFLAIRK